MRRALSLLALALALATPARAETLTLALSSEKVTIASNYAGADVTLFGALRDAGLGPYDIVITTRGPTAALSVREKAPVFGLWLNRSTRVYRDTPVFLSVLSNRPIPSLSLDPSHEGLGLAASAPGGDGETLAALIRIQTRRGLWTEDGEGVSFLDRDLFRATVRLPPKTPFGAFDVEARVYDGARLVARTTTGFVVEKAGVEAQIADVAERRRWSYGFATAGLALLFGWAASAMFRRD